MFDEPFAPDLTEIEAFAGFRLVEFPDHTCGKPGEPLIRKRVVHPFGKYYRVVKLRNPRGGVEYIIQQFGFYRNEAYQVPEWRVVDGFEETDPLRAAEEAPRYVKDHPADPNVVRLCEPPADGSDG
jgi:hypothetical protein